MTKKNLMIGLLAVTLAMSAFAGSMAGQDIVDTAAGAGQFSMCCSIAR